MRRKIVAGNWKMNTTVNEGIDLASQISDKLELNAPEDVKVIIAPPFTHLAIIKESMDSKYVSLASQNCATHDKGAYTGEVSASMLKHIGVDFIILGHSERRSYYGETSETLNLKVAQALTNKQEVIFCFGEVLEEREASRHFEVVKQQLSEVVFKLSASEFKNIILAYEPVWAIGTGKTASPEQAQEMHAFIRSLVAENFNAVVANDTSILYGGSCNAANARELFAKEDVDGGLIGGAALKAEDFLTIIQSY
jgi:triosephosphate isomerase